MGPSQMLVLLVVGAQLYSSAADPNATSTSTETTTTTYTQNAMALAITQDENTRGFYAFHDANADGTWDMAETMAANAAASGSCDAACGAYLMAMGDLDGDGHLTLYEFANLVMLLATTTQTTTTTYTQQAMYVAYMENKDTQDYFTLFDRNSDGFWNKTEIMTANAAATGACDSDCGDNFLKLGDLDGDTNINLYEFGRLVALLETTTETTTETVTHTVEMYKAKISGSFVLDVPDADAFIGEFGFVGASGAATGTVLALRQAICDMMTADPNQAFKPEPEMVEAILEKEDGRRLGSDRGPRRLSAPKVKVSFTVTIPTDSSLDANSLTDTFALKDVAVLAAAMKSELSLDYDITFEWDTEPRVKEWDPCEEDHPDCVETTTTTFETCYPDCGSSFARKQAAFTAAPVVAVLIGMVVMQ